MSAMESEKKEKKLINMQAENFLYKLKHFMQMFIQFWEIFFKWLFHLERNLSKVISRVKLTSVSRI